MNKNFLIIFVFILFTNNSLACDALRLTGTKVSTAQKTFLLLMDIQKKILMSGILFNTWVMQQIIVQKVI